VQADETLNIANDINEGRYNFDEEEKVNVLSGDRLKKRRERIEKESEIMRNAITDQGYMRMVDRFKKTFDTHM
jgi:hypothetical protein